MFKKFLILTLVLLQMAVFPVQKKIVVMWSGKSGMADRVLNGFTSNLKKISPEIEIETAKEIPTLKDAEAYFKKYEKSKDGIVFLRSNAADFLSHYKPKIPTFIGACNNPQSLGIIQNLENPEGNITGVTYYLDYSIHFNSLFLKIFPDLKSVCLVTEKGHLSSRIDRDGTKKICRQKNIKYQEINMNDLNQIIEQVKKVSPSVDLFIIGQQALVMENTKKIMNSTKKPLVSYSSLSVKNGALCAFATDDVKLGRLLAETVRDILIKEKKISTVPVKTDPKPGYLINLAALKRYRLKVPVNILKIADKIK